MSKRNLLRRLKSSSPAAYLTWDSNTMTLILHFRLWRRLRSSGLYLFLLLVPISQLIFAQEMPLKADFGDRRVVSRADTSSPRATLQSFMQACDEISQLIQQERFLDLNIPTHRASALRILDCLDTSELPEYSKIERAGEAAICLKEVLDRVELPSLEEIPDAEAFQQTDEQPSLFRWRIPGTRITIARVEEGPQRHEYLFTPGTVERAADYFEDMKEIPYRTHGRSTTPGLHRWYISAPKNPTIASLLDRLPDWFRDKKLGMTLWKWPGLLISLAAAVALMIGVYWLHKWTAVSSRRKGLVFYCLSIIVPSLAILVPIGYKKFAGDYLSLRGTPFYLVSFAADLVTLIVTAVVVFGISNRVAEIFIASPKIHPKGLDAQLIRILTKLVGFACVAIIFLEGGKHLGIPITTLMASAGVGGLAIALAAQDTLKALFGTITLMADKPFRVGDRIILQKYDGVVEDIGLRSTRIRLLTGHQATVPNDELARTDIENVSRRPHIRRVADIHLPLETSRKLTEEAIEIVRQLLDNHEGMDSEFPPRIFFNEFNDDSFNLRLIYWYHPPDYWQFQDYSQRLNLEICKAFEQRGIRFLLPSKLAITSNEGADEIKPA